MRVKCVNRPGAEGRSDYYRERERAPTNRPADLKEVVSREAAALRRLADLDEADAVACHESRPHYAEFLLARAQHRRALAADRKYIESVALAGMGG